MSRCPCNCGADAWVWSQVQAGSSEEGTTTEEVVLAQHEGAMGGAMGGVVAVTIHTYGTMGPWEGPSICDASGLVTHCA